MLDATPSASLEFLWLEPTQLCNLECPHCYAMSGPRAKPPALTKTDFEHVLEDARGLGCRQVQFIGGEATLSPDLPGLVRHADALGYTVIEVFSNLTRLTDDLVTLLANVGAHVATSVYGDTAEIHDAMTLRPGSWLRTIKTIERLVDAGVPINAGVIVSKINRSRVDATVSFLKNLGVGHVGYDAVRSLGRASTTIAGIHDERLEELCGGCADNVACVSPDGIIYPCIMSRFLPLGHVKDDGLATALSSRKTSAIRSKILKACEVDAGRPVLTKGLAEECFPCPPYCYPRCYPNRNWRA